MVVEVKRFFVKLCVLFSIITSIEMMTVKQVKNTGKMMRNTCQPKFKVVDEQIDHIKDGVFNEDHEVMCYISCILKMANTIKNGKLNFDAAMKQIDMLMPDEMKEELKKSLTACRKVPDGYKDVCEASFHVAKCMQNENPAVFLFP